MQKRALSLAFVILTILTAAIMPACGEGCCPVTDHATVHAQMPCCENEPPSVASPDAVRLQPATSVSLPQAGVPVTIASPPAAPAVAARMQPELGAALHEPPAPLFLLNAQFRI